jgi:hypothetical protein
VMCINSLEKRSRLVRSCLAEIVHAAGRDPLSSKSRVGLACLKWKISETQRKASMIATKRTILAAVFLGLSCLTSTGLAGIASATSCSISIPAGTIIRAYPDEHIVAGTTSGPLLFTVAADVRFFPNTSPIVPRGSKILAKMESSSQAGRLWGKAKARVVFTSVLTPDFCEYPIDATLIGTQWYQVREQMIVGRSHARRDVLALLFPPTTLYQLIRLPARGPKLTIDEEQQLTIKLVQPVYLARSESSSIAADIEQRRQSAASARSTSASPECPSLRRGPMAFPWRSGILRSFRNTTPYEVVVYGNGNRLGTIAPCTESILRLPRGELRLKAVATIPEDDGQREVEVALGRNEKLTGWQVLSLREKASTLR